MSVTKVGLHCYVAVEKNISTSKRKRSLEEKAIIEAQRSIPTPIVIRETGLEHNGQLEKEMKQHNNTKIRHLGKQGLDHLPLLIEITKNVKLKTQKRQIHFRFKQTWTKNHQCTELVKQAWRGTNISFIDKTKAIAKVFTLYQKKSPSLEQQIRKIENKIKRAYNLNASEEHTLLRRQQQKQLDDLLELQELYWKVELSESNSIGYGIPKSHDIADTTEANDIPVWKWARDGAFSVKSAYYHLIWELNAHNEDNSHSDGTKWDKIWKSHVPAKVQHFFFRALTNSLPTTTNLEKRGVETRLSCVFCQNTELESWDHYLLSCEWCNQLLESLPNTSITTYIDLRKWMEYLLQNFTENNLEETMMLLWSLWKQHNKIVFKDQNSNLPRIKQGAMNMWFHWKLCSPKK
ncbi:hypothetical protein VNO77_18093 [Canavalia gladiata]|uniref:Reverse transcriptase zinc-binding domain-containing protein n=1 Tax=Canavalia gladiata TaxID=3824 RepID=A0AAN9LK71_CANGL